MPLPNTSPNPKYLQLAEQRLYLVVLPGSIVIGLTVMLPWNLRSASSSVDYLKVIVMQAMMAIQATVLGTLMLYGVSQSLWVIVLFFLAKPEGLGCEGGCECG